MDDQDRSLSRRDLLKQGAAVAGSAAALAAPGALLAQASSPGPRPVVRRFRGWISRGTGPGRTTLHTLTARPVTGRQVLVRTEATNLCYSNVGTVLGIQRADAPPPGEAARRVAGMAIIQGHGGVGIVEAVGPEVRRVQVGDRVCVSGTPQCGSCYLCLRGRADKCQFLSRSGADDLVPIADMDDGTPVYANSHIGGLAELMVTFEEWVVPVFTQATAVDLGMVCSCVTVAGLGATMAQVPGAVGPGSTVAVVGCGPLGLSAVQGAKIAGASTIIAIEPIGERRELARTLGATHTLDPNAEGPGLVEKVRELTRISDRFWAGGRNPGGGLSGAGADFVVEAAGADHVPSRLEPAPDPTGILPIQQAYEMCAAGGDIVTTSLPRGMVSLPGVMFAIGGRTHHAGQAGGANPLRDIPRFVALLDKGQFDARSLATTVVPLERMLEAYEAVAYRTTVTAIMTA